MDTDRRERFVQHCSRCGGRILWTVTTNGKRMPVNVLTADNGNVQLSRTTSGIYAHVLGPAEATRLREAGRRLHLAHAASCRRWAPPLRPASRIR